MKASGGRERGLAAAGRDREDREADGNPVAEGETGELWLKGPNVFAGYWKREEATRGGVRGRLVQDRRHRRRARRTATITLSGRKSDLIISGGFNIYPSEIEEFLMEQPEVEEAAVVAEADRVRGEIPVAYVVWKNGSGDAGPLEMRCREKLASFKIPRRFETIEKAAAQRAGQSSEALTMSRILMITSEAAPFAKTGGLADVLGRIAAGACEARRGSGGGDAAL